MAERREHDEDAQRRVQDVPHLVAEPQRPPPDRGHHQQPERGRRRARRTGPAAAGARGPAAPGTGRRRGTAAPGARTPQRPPGTRSAGGSSGRRRSRRAPNSGRTGRRGRTAVPRTDSASEPQGDREVDDEPPPRLELGHAEGERSGGDRRTCMLSQATACGRSSRGRPAGRPRTPAARAVAGRQLAGAGGRSGAGRRRPRGRRRIQQRGHDGDHRERRTEPSAGVRGQAAWRTFRGRGHAGAVDEDSRAQNRSLLIRD